MFRHPLPARNIIKRKRNPTAVLVIKYQLEAKEHEDNIQNIARFVAKNRSTKTTRLMIGLLFFS